jgi:hypothetical protein
MSLIGEDIAVQVSFGGPVDGTPTYGTAASIKCVARRISISEDVDQIDVTTLCNGRRKFRPGKATLRVEIEGLVPAAGYSFRSTGVGVGTYIKVETKPTSSLASYDAWEGMIASWAWDAAENSAQVERITIVGDPVVTA